MAPMIAAPRISQPKIGIVGDDLTGVAAVSGAFAGQGFRCLLAAASEGRLPAGLLSGERPHFEALSLVTESRHLSSALAEAHVQAAVEGLRQVGCSYIFKKVDSLLRGHVAPELKALLRAVPGQSVMLAVAAPASGRVTRNGVQVRLQSSVSGEGDVGSYIRDRPTSDHIPSLLRAALPENVTVVALNTSAGEAALATASQPGRQHVFVCDAESSADIHAWARWGARAGIKLFAGTSEFASAVAGVLAEIARESRKVLVLVGSASSNAHAQLHRLQQGGLGNVAWLNAATFERTDTTELADKASNLGSGRAATVLAITAPDGAMDSSRAAALADTLGQIGAEIICRESFSAVIATGGDTAMALLRRTGIGALEPQAMLEPGIPLSTVRGGLCDGMTLVTKPGAYGDDDCLVRLVSRLTKRAEKRTSLK
jgi:uncharacterized protein YgbK (DUF1537 family)